MPTGRSVPCWMGGMVTGLSARCSRPTVRMSSTSTFTGMQAVAGPRSARRHGSATVSHCRRDQLVCDGRRHGIVHSGVHRQRGRSQLVSPALRRRGNLASDSEIDHWHGRGPLASATWCRAWDDARRITGLTHYRFHDLRHAGNTLAAATAASTRELMGRMGHASPRAALIYQHATSERDQAIAAALSEFAQRSLDRSATAGSLDERR
jgi:hypothetical protein